jgi:hypothetical protein
MSTPVNYQLTLLDNTPEEPTESTFASVINSSKQQQQLLADTASPTSAIKVASSSRSSSSSSSSNEANLPAHAADGAALSFSGSGFAHMEKNWGAAFPEQWVWAQGTSSDGQVNC